MLRTSIILTSAICAGFAQASEPAAVVPKLSGAYIVNYNEICQMNNPSNPSQGVGQTYSEVLTVTFTNTAKAKAVTMQGTELTAPLTGPYAAPQSSAINTGPTTYSNTATTLTIGGSTFNIEYGQLNSAGVAQSAAFVGVSHGGCAASATAILK